jgi:hypothetical protein
VEETRPAGTLTAAAWAVHERARLAFAAANRSDLPGVFRTFRAGGLMALLTTAPGLSFLNTVSGVDAETAPGLPRVLATFQDAGAPRPTLVGGPTGGLDGVVRRLGYRPTASAPMGVATLGAGHLPTTSEAQDVRVTGVGDGPALKLFLDVLRRGYHAHPAVSRFVLAEHADPSVHRFLAWRGTEPIAAAALSLHRTVAVLGGAATLADERDRGAQAALLRHRLGVAAQAGAQLAAATAAPDSPSARNLTRAGFLIIPRYRWSASDDFPGPPWTADPGS